MLNTFASPQLNQELSNFYKNFIVNNNNLKDSTNIYHSIQSTQGIIWNISSFDQWGVDRGKILTNDIINYLSYNDKVNDLNLDSSTLKLIEQYQKHIKLTAI